MDPHNRPLTSRRTRPRGSAAALLAACLSAVSIASQAAGSWGAYAQVQGMAWSNGLPVADINGDWQAARLPVRKDLKGYAVVSAETGASGSPHAVADPGAWRLGVLYRQEVDVRLSPGAAAQVQAYQAQVDVAEGTYDSRHQTRRWAGRGVVLHLPSLRWAQLQWGGSVQGLVLDKLSATATEGQTRFDAGAYAYDIQLQEYNQRSRSDFLAPPATGGHGASASLDLQWRPQAPWRLQLKVHDLWSRLTWQGIHLNQARINSAVSSLTEDGYLDYQAAIQGRYTPGKVVTRIPTTVEAQGHWQRPEGTWSVLLHRRSGLQQSWLQWQSPNELSWVLGLEPRAQALRAGLDWAGWSLRLMTDRFNGDATTQALSLSFAWPR